MISTTTNPLRRYREYIGLSTDSKPVNCAANSLFLELDTGDFYYFDDGVWKIIGWNKNN